MCTNCGCSDVNSATLHWGAEHHDHVHLQDDSHSNGNHNHNHNHQNFHLHDFSPVQTLDVHARLLSKNDHFALQNRNNFHAHGLLTLNILSSPGSGKTSLIERMAKVRGNRAAQVGVIVGDLATENDAQRLRATGATALQITTGTACHLEADMVAHAVSHLDLTKLELLIIENVGNLVCPAAYDLGETLRVVMISVTEGEDKPLKYPTAFQSADVVLLSKIDIADAVAFDRKTAIANIRQMAPQAHIFELSARTGEGMDAWLIYLQSQLKRSHLPLEAVQ